MAETVGTQTPGSVQQQAKPKSDSQKTGATNVTTGAGVSGGVTLSTLAAVPVQSSSAPASNAYSPAPTVQLQCYADPRQLEIMIGEAIIEGANSPNLERSEDELAQASSENQAAIEIEIGEAIFETAPVYEITIGEAVIEPSEQFEITIGPAVLDES